ncbi:MAG: hypothetical protein OXU20_21700 [Myxococcales bacterium]|nr:hypothetical protein [Myxococcales bacterium]MDD9966977.1 hypothetical protein [Myxococcales bacterium]
MRDTKANRHRTPEATRDRARRLRGFDSIADELAGLDTCFWCLGISAVGLDEVAYTRITHDYTMAAAKVLRERSPELRFCFVRGAGTDAEGRQMWARVESKTENALKEVGFRDLVLFRPAFIRRVRGNPPRGAYRVLGPVLSVLDPLLRATGGATSNVDLATDS